MSSLHLLPCLAAGLLPSRAAASMHNLDRMPPWLEHAAQGMLSAIDGTIEEWHEGKPWRKRAAAPGEADDGQQSNQSILYGHMPKAGGTFLIPVLRSAVGWGKFEFRSEFRNLTKDDVGEHFVVGSVRNPCDYYVSLWAYGSDHGGAMMSAIPEDKRYMYEDLSADRSSHSDILKFRKWVKMLNKKGYPGVMSVRFARSYAVLDRVIRAAFPPMALTNAELNSVRRALVNREWTDRVDCWIRMESLDADAKACLSDWQQKTGGEVNWTAYTHTSATANQLSSRHAPCRDYFTPELQQYVRELEAPIFDFFKYETCCA